MGYYVTREPTKKRLRREADKRDLKLSRLSRQAVTYGFWYNIVRAYVHRWTAQPFLESLIDDHRRRKKEQICVISAKDMFNRTDLKSLSQGFIREIEQ